MGGWEGLEISLKKNKGEGDIGEGKKNQEEKTDGKQRKVTEGHWGLRENPGPSRRAESLYQKTEPRKLRESSEKRKE